MHLKIKQKQLKKKKIELFFNKNLTDKLIRDGYLAIEKVNQESKISEEKLEEIEEELER